VTERVADGLAPYAREEQEGLRLAKELAVQRSTLAPGLLVAHIRRKLRHRRLDSEAFARERLGIWREDETPSPFPPGAWDALAYQGHLEVVGTPCFSVDVTPARDHSTIAVAARTDTDRPLVEVVETQRGTSWVVPKLQEVLERYRGAKVIVDRSAWAASLVEDIRAADLAVHETDAAEVSTAAGQFLEAVLEQKFFHRGDPRLTTAVEGSRQRAIGQKWGWDRKLPTVDVSPLVAASLALWGLRVLKPTVHYVWFPDADGRYHGYV
jgi:hypothetical protein